MLENGTMVGGFRVEGLLGRGGMGTVYEATQVALGRQVALKLLDDRLAGDSDFAARFRREGEAQAQLDHPHVVPVYEAGESEHGLYLAMRLVPGVSLSVLLAGGELTAARAVGLIGQVADALDAAHAAGLIHRDVKPHNILVEGGDNALLADFGLAKSVAQSGITGGGSLLGTVAYLAPEVIAGAEAGPAADRYALAAVLFECMTGNVPFPRASTAAVLHAHTTEPPPRVGARRSELPGALDNVFAKALAKDPRERPSTARAMVDAVRSAIGDERLAMLGPPPQKATPTPATTDEPRSAVQVPVVARKQRRGAVLGTAVLAAAVGVGATLAVGAGGETTTKTRKIPPPPIAKGAKVLGASLEDTGDIVSRPCVGNGLKGDVAPCSIVQRALPGHPFIVPTDGVVIGWALRGATGEFQLQAFRDRDGGVFQIGASQYEISSDVTPQRYAANIEVERGDRLGVLVGNDSKIGMREVAGATTQRWITPLRGYPPRKPEKGPGTGRDGEVEVRIELLPNVKRKLPGQLNGAAAAKAPEGKVVRSKSLTYDNGKRVVVQIVALKDRLVFDLRNSKGKRVARADLPGTRPGGWIAKFYTLNYGGGEDGEAGIVYVNPFSGRTVERFYGVSPAEFAFYS
jgi:hypothetical protein